MVEPGPIPEVGLFYALPLSRSGSCCEASLRECRIAIAAVEHLEAHFVEQVHALWFEPQLWIFLPPKSLTVSFRALLFSVISRAHCAMDQVLQVPHEQSLVWLFALLERPDLAASMAHTPPWMMDLWTQEMLRLHPGFVGDEFMGKLTLLATLLWTESVASKLGTATIRRPSMNASANTHTLSFLGLSARWGVLAGEEQGGRRSALGDEEVFL